MADAQEIPEVIRKYYPGGFFGHDKDGRPVFIQPFGRLDIKGLLHSAHAKDLLSYKRVQSQYAYEDCKRQEELLGKTFEKHSTVIIDMEGVSKKQIWLPGLKIYQDIINLLETEYPNGCQQVLIVNSPFVFHKMFQIIKPLLGSESKKKIKAFGGEWKSDLLKFINADNLPEHYGGSCKDDNGSPKCEQYICYGGDIPLSYYVNANLKTDNFHSEEIKAGGKFIVSQIVDNANSVIKYQFLTSYYDIDFSVLLEVPDGENSIILKEEKIPSHIIMESGSINCKEAGKYLFCFSNSHRLFCKKKLKYHLEVEHKDHDHEINATQ